MDSERVAGACLCGAVRFEIELPTLFCAHCHCSMCRRAHGAGFVTWCGVPRARFHLLAGAAQLVRYGSSEHATRSFCGICGSSLLFESTQRPDDLDTVLANLQAPIDRAPEFHVHYSDHADWVQLADALPRLGGPTGLEPLE